MIVRRSAALGAAAALLGLALPSAVPASPIGLRPQLALHAQTAAGSEISGLYPADIADAYGLTGGVAGTIGIVIAYHDPSLESDLAVYRAEFGLPPCTAASGCLRIVNQAGAASPLPSPNPGWATEESLDVQAVSASCPACSILVVEASSSSSSDMFPAENTAVSLGADAVSNSWGGLEPSGWTSVSSAYFTHPGVPILAAAGDGDDLRAIVPAALPNVIAVGGTTLARTDPGTDHVGGVHVATSTSSQAIVAGDDVAAATGRIVAPLHASASPSSADRERVRTLTARVQRDRAHLASLTKALRTATAATKHAHGAARTAALRHEHHVRSVRGAAAKRLTRSERSLASARRALARDRKTPAPTPTPVPTPAPVASPVAAPTPGSAPPVPGWTETAWAGGESGCASWVARPAWQAGANGGCATRAIADLAADADPDSGLAVYDGFGAGGWVVVGGTSLATPLVAGMLVRSGHASAYSNASTLYANAGAFRDIESGSSARCWATSCSAGVGYDLPTGVGAPNGLASF